MPTYEYECTKCGHSFEFFQSMSEEPLKKCPKCSASVKRLIGKGAGIIFKGPGFYATDYKKTKEAERDINRCPDSDKGYPPCRSCNAKPSDNKR